MAYTEQVGERINFAIDSPDFWRGLGIALAVLAGFVVIRSLIRVVRNSQPRQLTSSRWAQAAGLTSWLMMATAVVGDQFTRLGQDDTSWRLPFAILGAALGIAWALGTIKTMRDEKKIDPYNKKH